MDYNEGTSLSKQLMWGTIAGGIVLVIVVIGLFSEFDWESVLGGLLLIYFFFAFIFLVVDSDSIINDIFVGAFYKTVGMPGIIYSLDLSGVVFMLIYRFIIAPLITFVIGLVITILGFVLAFLLSGVIFPFVLIKKLLEERGNVNIND